MGATSKQRTPSRCREWERERRNKFNQAIVKLGELIKSASKEEASSTDADNTQYPKVEVIQRAILYITDFAREKSKLKAEVLALQVKLDEITTKVLEKKDVGTQISKGAKMKLQSSKYNKILMIKKCNKGKPSPVAKTSSKTLPSVSLATTTETTSCETQAVPISSHPLLNLPKLVPKSTNSKGQENAIVVMAATPYLIPQRPLLYPAPPPTFLLLNPSSMPTMNKSSISMLNRASHDITRTTMVNVLPISAYSRPLSASKLKKNNVKQKAETVRKKSKPIKKITVHKDVTQCVYKTTLQDIASTNEVGKKQDDTKTNSESIEKSCPTTAANINDKQTIIPDKTTSSLVESKSQMNTTHSVQVKLPEEVPKIQANCDKTQENNISDENNMSIAQEKVISSTIVPNEKSCKLPPLKDEPPVDKNKLNNMLESTLCENTVDGGNARLELAEELLAASPTAAFLMSFPLVSGNRADSPAEEPQNVPALKDNAQRRNDLQSHLPMPCFEKANTNNIKDKSLSKENSSNINILDKDINPHKYSQVNASSKQVGVKTPNSATVTSAENSFLNLPVPSTISTSCTLADPTFVLDFDCNITKALPSQTPSYANNSIFYKSDPFTSGKNAIYSTSSIPSGHHDFNSLGLYPCAMEKYSSKTKTDYSNVEDNLMKIGSSRLTYDIDLGWSHKGFEFVNCTTTSATFPKDNILTTTVSAPYTTSYNPFNPEFHVPLVSSTSKKDNISKPSSSFVDTIASFYSQTSNLWSDEMPFYTSNSISNSKSFPSKHQNYFPLEHTHTSVLSKQNNSKQYETKQVTESCAQNILKTPSLGMSHQVSDKYTKKSPSKMHINWMTSETRPMQNNPCNITHGDVKDHSRPYTQIEHAPKKQDQSDGNYFPISIHNYHSHTPQEEFQVWPSARPLGTTEVSIDPPPINLPTLVGDLALGPHDKKRQNAESHSSRVASQADIQQNCGNFLSVTQLMDRSTDPMSRYHGTNEPASKPTPAKQSAVQYVSEHNRKLSAVSRLDANLPQPCYSFNDSKAVHSYESLNNFTNTKAKSSKTSDKSAKNQKHSYSAEALIRGNTYTQKLPDTNKFVMPSQKYSDYNPQQDTSVAQVSHFPPIIDYADNCYPAQQFSGTSIYNSTTNTISNSFYSNFMPSSSNLMATNYTGAPFSSEFVDYNQSTECNNYPNQKYEEFKIKGNPPVFHHEKGSNNHKTSRREFTTKHKIDCSKKDSSKKYQNKRPKLSTEVEDWSDTNLLWQNKTPSKRHPNLMGEDLAFPNYVGNQIPSQYQPDLFNSHLMPPNVQSMGHNVDRSLTSFPPTSRANFNLSTLFPEITMKVQ